MKTVKRTSLGPCTHGQNTKIEIGCNTVLMGRPAFDRSAFRRLLTRQPHSGRLVIVNARHLAALIGCHRSSIGRILDDLETSADLRRFRNRGRRGLLVQLLPADSCRAEQEPRHGMGSSNKSIAGLNDGIPVPDSDAVTRDQLADNEAALGQRHTLD